MRRVVGGIAAASAILVLGGALFLYFWDIPAPQQPVEIEFEDDRFPR